MEEEKKDVTASENTTSGNVDVSVSEITENEMQYEKADKKRKKCCAT